jgi:hypothetical protein
MRHWSPIPTRATGTTACHPLRLGAANAFAGGDIHATVPARWMYFSFMTLTTVGYDDVTPIAPAAHSLVVLEALLGQLYPAIILARLVSLRGAPTC